MQVLPVIDVLKGQVVHAVAGDRANYRPIQSKLVDSAEPAAIARALKRLGFSSVYVADLDAIQHRKLSRSAMDGIAATGLNIWLDAGISDGKFAAEIADFAPMGTPLAGVIVGLETLQRPTELVKIATTIGAERAIFSLDLRNGTPNTQVPTWQNADPMQIITAAVEAGFHRVVVLDLARVGTGRGVATLPLCQKIKRRWPDIAVFTGGGVRAAHDLQAVAESGCDGVLVASAIHDGSWPFANATSW